MRPNGPTQTRLHSLIYFSLARGNAASPMTSLRTILSQSQTRNAQAGITGALLTAVFCDPSLGGTGVYDYVANEVAPYSMSAQFIAQLWAVGTTVVWSGVVSVIGFALVKATIGLRVSEDQEREGLDTVSHGESAYT